MKLLIITASAGMGHNRAAAAIKEYTQTHHFDIQTKTIDFINCIDSRFSKWFFFQSYEQIVKTWPKFWAFWFWVTENKFTGKIFDYLSAKNLKPSADKLLLEIKNFAPDYILCTHFAPPSLIDRFFDLKTPMATVVTDFYPNRLWSLAKNQKFFVATEFTKQQLEKTSINPKNIIVGGIPVMNNFFKQPQETKENNQEKNILIMPIPNGKIKLKKLINKLNKNFPNYKITIICGKNNSQKNKLEKNFCSKNNIKILGLINNPEDYMRTADLIISKAGGIIISEILTLKKPLIIVNPIPGQENKNADFLTKNNLAIWANTETQVIKIIKNIKLKTTKLKTLDFIKNPTQIILDNFIN